MDREKMLKKLHAIKTPRIALTGYYDGVTCDYMTSKGCGGFELLDWSDLDKYHFYDPPNRVWEELCDDELEDWIERLLKKNGDFFPHRTKHKKSCS